jgi:hypothetical protein
MEGLKDRWLIYGSKDGWNDLILRLFNDAFQLRMLFDSARMRWEVDYEWCVSTDLKVSLLGNLPAGLLRRIDWYNGTTTQNTAIFFLTAVRTSNHSTFTTLCWWDRLISVLVGGWIAWFELSVYCMGYGPPKFNAMESCLWMVCR